MDYQRFGISRLHVAGHDLPVAEGHGVVVRRGDVAPGRVDWELIVRSVDPVWLEPARHEVALVDTQGRDLHGPAVLVRSDGDVHVFRGDGALEGLPPSA